MCIRDRVWSAALLLADEVVLGARQPERERVVCRRERRGLRHALALPGRAWVRWPAPVRVLVGVLCALFWVPHATGARACVRAHAWGEPFWKLPHRRAWSTPLGPWGTPLGPPHA